MLASAADALRCGVPREISSSLRILGKSMLFSSGLVSDKATRGAFGK